LELQNQEKEEEEKLQQFYKDVETKKLKRKAREAKEAKDMRKKIQLQARADEENMKAHNEAMAKALEIAKTGTTEEILKARSEVTRIFERTPDERVKQLKTQATFISDNDDGDETAESSEDDSDGHADTQKPPGDLQGLDILQRLATDDKGKQLTDNKGNAYWGKFLNINNVKRTYIVQEKKENEWKLVSGGLSTPFHNFTGVSKLTGHNNNTKFNNIGDSVMIGKFRITLWSKSLLFDLQRYLDKSDQ
jgi:hypothetical protein